MPPQLKLGFPTYLLLQFFIPADCRECQGSVHPSGNTVPFGAMAIFCLSTSSASPWERDVAALLVLGVRLSQGSKRTFHETPLCRRGDSGWHSPLRPTYKASDPAHLDLKPLQNASSPVTCLHQCLSPAPGRATPRGTSQNLGKSLGGLSSSFPPREEGFQHLPLPTP